MPTKQNIYERLREHLNESPIFKLRKTKEIMKILELLFTQEQAEYAVKLPLNIQGGITLEEAAAKINKNVQDVEATLECMGREGKVLVTTNKEDGVKRYALWTYLVGIMEATFADGVYNDKKRNIAKLHQKYFTETFGNEMYSSDTPILRILPINQQVEPASQVMPYEDVQTWIENAETITVINCLCREMSRKCDHMVEAEFVFGEWAEYFINYRGARKWSKEEALQKLKECREEGLVQLSGNVQGESAVVCNCCSCCCQAFRGQTELHNKGFVRSNFMPKVDQEKCTRCGICQKICPIEAICKVPGFKANGSDSFILVKEDRCIGCGLCATHCPAEAIRMVKVRDYIPPETGMELVERHLKDRIF